MATKIVGPLLETDVRVLVAGRIGVIGPTLNIAISSQEDLTV